jgi:hypothetical protein
MASFGQFLGSHEGIARDVTENPDVVKDHEYVDNHQELKSYLDANPQVRSDLMADPHNFVKGAQQATSGNGAGAGSNGTPGTSNPSPSTHDTKPKQ